jgi:hypothetical protein
MSRRQQIRGLQHGNRALIALLSIAGMLLDGGRIADLPMVLALLLWLWSAELQALELALLRRLRAPNPLR